MKEYELFNALRPHYPPREFALLPQVANGTGSGCSRHADAIALSLWPSRGLTLSGFEIKSYRGDWVRELRDPEKGEDIGQFCDFWWIVAAAPFVKDEELPETWGLMVWDREAGTLKKQKRAPQNLAAKRPDMAFIAGILRKAQEVVTPDAVIATARAESFESGKKEGLASAKYELERHAELKQKVRDFEKASGIRVDSWDGGEKIGKAVHEVLNGTAFRQREELVGIAKKILEGLQA